VSYSTSSSARSLCSKCLVEANEHVAMTQLVQRFAPMRRTVYSCRVFAGEVISGDTMAGCMGEVYCIRAYCLWSPYGAGLVLYTIWEAGCGLKMALTDAWLPKTYLPVYIARPVMYYGVDGKYGRDEAPKESSLPQKKRKLGGASDEDEI